MALARLTVTLPVDLVRDIDRRETNRSRFVLAAVRRELAWRRREELRRSLGKPHTESLPVAAEGLADWGARLPDEDAGALVDPRVGRPVRWVAGKGWVER